MFAQNGKWGDHVANKTSTSKMALSGVDVYYGRYLDLFEAIGYYNKVNGIYQKLDQLCNGEWTPGHVRAAFEDTYGSDPKAVKEAREMYNGRVSRLLDYVGEALKVLGIPHTEGEMRSFEMLARSTTNESKFRAVIGRYIVALRKEIVKGIELEKAGFEIEPLHVETPTDLIRYYQATDEERREIKKTRKVKKVTSPKKGKAAKK